jgi:hypothetical protein
VQLPTTTEPGYGQKQLPVEEIGRLEGLSGEPRAVIVWFYSREDEKINRGLESGIFKDEPTALALQMFKRVKIDVETITLAPLKKAYGHTPTFVVIDPKGAILGKVAGKKASARSGFKGLVSKVWGQLFTMKQRDYQKLMTKILNRLDSVDGKLTVIRAKEARLATKPNAGKTKALAKEKAALAIVKEKIEADEAEIKKRCTLKPEFLDPEEGADR